MAPSPAPRGPAAGTNSSMSRPPRPSLGAAWEPVSPIPLGHDPGSSLARARDPVASRPLPSLRSPQPSRPPPPDHVTRSARPAGSPASRHFPGTVRQGLDEAPLLQLWHRAGTAPAPLGCACGLLPWCHHNPGRTPQGPTSPLRKQAWRIGGSLPEPPTKDQSHRTGHNGSPKAARPQDPQGYTDSVLGARRQTEGVWASRAGCFSLRAPPIRLREARLLSSDYRPED